MSADGAGERGNSRIGSPRGTGRALRNQANRAAIYLRDGLHPKEDRHDQIRHRRSWL